MKAAKANMAALSIPMAAPWSNQRRGNHRFFGRAAESQRLGGALFALQSDASVALSAQKNGCSLPAIISFFVVFGVFSIFECLFSFLCGFHAVFCMFR